MTADDGEDVEIEENFSIAGGIPSWYNPSGNQFSSSLEIPLLGIYSENDPTCNKGISSSMFIAALFIIAKSWKETRCPSIVELIQKIWYIYTMEYYSAIKKTKLMKLLGK